MKQKKIRNILLIIIILVLFGGNVYFISESKKPMYKILIGTPTDSGGIHFGDAVKNSEDAQVLELALMRSNSIDKPEISNRLPDAAIWLNDWNVGVAYLVMDVWFDEDKVIFALGGKDSEFDVEYKATVGTFGADVQNIISKYKPTK